MICAKGLNVTQDHRNSGPCSGDDGGPLVCDSDGQWTLYGVFSHGRGCSNRAFPWIWARVTSQLDWIEDILAGNEPTTPAPTCPGYCSLCILSACKERCSFCQ